MSYQSMSDDEAAPLYEPPSPIIIPATPPSELDSDNEDQKQENKPFRLTDLPGVIITKLCDYLELSDILDLKFNQSWPRCQHLQKYLTKKLCHNHIVISSVGTLMHYSTPRPYSRYVMSAVKTVELANFIDDIDCSSFYSKFKLHTISVQSSSILFYGLPWLFDPTALRVMKISSSTSELIVYALKALHRYYPNVEVLEIDQCYARDSDVGDISNNTELFADDKGKRMIWPNLKTLKVTVKNFMCKQKNTESIKFKFPKLEEIHEPDIIWKLGASGQWQAETEAVELALRVSYKRKLVDLTTMLQTVVGERCSYCLANSVTTYPFHGKSACLSCVMMRKANYKMKQDIMELVQEKKKQKICCQEVKCECDMLLDENTVSLL